MAFLKTTKALRALGPIDLKSVRRDSFLRWMCLFPFLIAFAFRWGVPPLTSYLNTQYQFDLAEYYILIMSFLVVVMPSLVGAVIGFLLLDQRDDHTLSALQVTPLTLNGYLTYRLSIPMLLSILTTLLIYPIAGLIKISTWQLLLTAICAAPLAPMFALFLASFASNKVQGFSLMKASGVINWPPIFAWFVHSDWQLVFGLIPTYWPVKVFWQVAAGESNFVIYLLAGLLYQMLLLWLLLKRFHRVMHR